MFYFYTQMLQRNVHLLTELTRIRRQAGISQTEAARFFGCTRQRYARIEQGKSDVNVLKLCEFVKKCGFLLEISQNNTV